jgi:ribosomal protein S12 methylthiotransferase accessory factor
LNLLTLDIDMPVILAIQTDELGAAPLTSVGISANTNPLAAIVSAVEEACQSRILLNRLSDLPTSEIEFRQLRDHLIGYATSKVRSNSLRFLTEADQCIDVEQVLARFAPDVCVSDVLKKSNIDAAWIDVTTNDVQSCGIHVVRVIVPNMTPLDIDHRFRFLGAKRLVTVPRKMGIQFKVPLNVNPDPHPFP